jgi:hypothetical protein
MDRSLRFRVCPRELNRPVQTRFRSGSGAEHLSLARKDNSPDHNAKGTQSPRTPPKGRTRLLPLVGTRFQVLFHSPPGVLFTFPSRYSCTIGRGRVFSLGGWSPRIQPGLLGAPSLLRYLCHTPVERSPTGLSPATADRSRSLRLHSTGRAGEPRTGPSTPDPRKSPVWAAPLSLAATRGISFDFFSSGY